MKPMSKSCFIYFLRTHRLIIIMLAHSSSLGDYHFGVSSFHFCVCVLIMNITLFIKLPIIIPSFVTFPFQEEEERLQKIQEARRERDKEKEKEKERDRDRDKERDKDRKERYTSF